MGEAIVFTSGKGGVGKTTTTVNLGVGLASVRIGREVRVLKSDFDAWLDSNTK